MPAFELKVEVALGAVPALEELLAEHEEQRLMLIEDKPSGRAWLTGYFARGPRQDRSGRGWPASSTPRG